MKKINLFMIMFALVFTASAQSDSETVVELDMNPGYTQEVYYKFPQTQAVKSLEAHSWDIAFYRLSAMDFGERVNDAKGIIVHHVSNNPNDFDSVNLADSDSWTQLNNSDIRWPIGAFDRVEPDDPGDPFSFGWGYYNVGIHVLEGRSVFVLEYPAAGYGPDAGPGSYKKFFIDNYASGYTIKYASWYENSNTWGETHETTVSNSAAEGNPLFNYYSLEDHTLVESAPDEDEWDIVFMQYATDLSTQTGSDNPFYYKVTGVLQNPNTEVAVSLDPEPTLDDLSFSEDINTIGYDWKATNEDFEYEVDSDTYYYVKQSDGTIYKLRFLSFEGTSTGKLSFAFEDVTNQLDVEYFDPDTSLSIYPNPTAQRQVNILYDTSQATSMGLRIYDISGRELRYMKVQVDGFNQQNIDLTGFSSGVYLMKFTTGVKTVTKRLILN